MNNESKCYKCDSCGKPVGYNETEKVDVFFGFPIAVPRCKRCLRRRRIFFFVLIAVFIATIIAGMMGLLDK